MTHHWEMISSREGAIYIAASAMVIVSVLPGMVVPEVVAWYCSLDDLQAEQ